MTLIKKKEDLSHADFQAYWKHEHAEIVTRSPNVGTYVQSHPIYKDELEVDATIDGLAEIWFEDTNAMRKLAATEEYKDIQEDEKVFIDSKAIRLIIAEDILTMNGDPTDQKVLLFTKVDPRVDLNNFRNAAVNKSFDSFRQKISRSKVSLPKMGGYKNGKGPEWDSIFTFWLKASIAQSDIEILIKGVSDISSSTISKYCSSIVIQEK